MALCHGLQSFFDNQKVNTDQEKKFRHGCDSSDYQESVFSGSHGWNSLNFLCNPVKESASPPPAIYTKQRLVKSINFDMCTETLGCETGAMCSSYELEITTLKKKNPPSSSKMEIRKQRSAPPPLTTLSGDMRLFLRRKREEGRLMLLSFKSNVIEADRSGGRLLLRFSPRE